MRRYKLVYFFHPQVDNSCLDSEENKHAHGDEWNEGCEHCRCDNGFKVCISPMCIDPPEDQQCTLRLETENDCCPQFDCEEGT